MDFDDKILREAREHFDSIRKAALRMRPDFDENTSIDAAFMDCEDHPDFDDDAGVNFDMGVLHGIARALGITTSELAVACDYGAGSPREVLP